MKPIQFILIALIFFAVVITGALVWDSTTAVNTAYETIMAADGEVKIYEDKFVTLAKALPQKDRELTNLVQSYEHAATDGERRKIFSDLAATAQRIMIDENNPSDPMRRRVFDEAVGALNRRQVTERHLAAAIASYNSIMSSYRGSIAKLVGTEHPDRFL